MAVIRHQMIYDLSAWCGCWFVVYIRKFIYKFFKVCAFLITRLLQEVRRLTSKPVNNTIWVAVVTPTDRPKSVRNRCVIELFCGVVCAVTLPLWHFCWCRDFCHRTESDLFLFCLVILPGVWDKPIPDVNHIWDQKTLTQNYLEKSNVHFISTCIFHVFRQ